MTTLATPSDYKKDFLPGYTGHVPSKNERYGATNGQIKREVLGDRGKHPVTLQLDNTQDFRLYSDRYTPKIDKNKMIFGNTSRFAKNWACGPNHMINSQQVPGYTGYIPGLVSEGLFSRSYGNSTAQAIAKKHPIGFESEPKQRFQSQSTNIYKAKNFRRFIEKPDLQKRKDYDDYTKFINDTYSAEKEHMLSQTLSQQKKTEGFKSAFTAKSLNTLSTYGDRPCAFMHMRNKVNGKGNSTEAEKMMGSTFTDFNVKPMILESKVST